MHAAKMPAVVSGQTPAGVGLRNGYESTVVIRGNLVIRKFREFPEGVSVMVTGYVIGEGSRAW